MKKNISLWYKEMDAAGLTKEEQKILEEHFLEDYGTPSSQEKLMLILMDERVCGFSLGEANKARKICSKKLMDKVAALKKEVIERASSSRLGEYVWKLAIEPSMSYSFSRIHGYSYSMIACQGAYLATHFPEIYWNTAYLRVISGLDDDDSSNYGKIATGIGEIKKHGVEVKLVDINKSGYMFEPDEEHNAILYGMKAISGVNGETIENIVINRPYNSLFDFMEKCPCNKTIMISLVKSGAFDSFDKRENIMREYIWSACEPKKRITMQNFNMLNEFNLLPRELSLQSRTFVFNKALKKDCKINKNFFSMNSNFYEFYEQFFDIDLLVPWDRGLAINVNDWKKQYDEMMLPAKKYIQENKDELLEELNTAIFQEMWDKYAAGTISGWEMESVGFYYHDHELQNVDNGQYGIIEFDGLSPEPVVAKTFRKNGRDIPIYKTFKICGTVIAKNDIKSSVSILTKNSGVVNVKFTRDYYARLNAQLSQVGWDGKKHVIEKSWFQKGTWLLVNGFRRGEQFVAKAYKKDNTHQCQRITKVYNSGLIDFTYQRAGEND